MTADAQNYPFCTIEPNTGIVNVPDARLARLAVINKSVKTNPSIMEFVDIAGIVKGASEGAGLGNKFLANIRSTDAIVHVVRCFEDINIIHVDSSVDPVRDMEVINLELILADLAQVDKRLDKANKDKKGNKDELVALTKLSVAFNEGISARGAGLDESEQALVEGLQLLSMKPVIYAANVADCDLANGNDMSRAVFEHAAKENSSAVRVSAQVESELCLLDVEDRKDFLDSLDVDEDDCGLKVLVRSAYKSLGLQTFYTSGPTETRAWTIRKGSTAPQAAGVIHSDFERGFIRAETIAYADLDRLGDEKLVKDAGLMRSEGKEYIMQQDDIVLFRFNVSK
jgi:GTP-binding protein YchF